MIEQLAGARFAGLGLAAGLAALALPAPGRAESFIFTSEGAPVDEVTTALSLGGGKERQLGSGLRFGAATTTGSVTSRSGGGAPRQGTYVCIQWGQPAGEDLNAQGVCEVTEGPDKFSYQFRCNLKDNGGQDGWCWSNLVGEAGRYQGKLGIMGWRATGHLRAGQGAWSD